MSRDEVNEIMAHAMRDVFDGIRSPQTHPLRASYLAGSIGSIPPFPAHFIKPDPTPRDAFFRVLNMGDSE